MNTVLLELPTFSLIVMTRAALAFGAGLLMAERLPRDRRRAIGVALVAVGAVTTVPAVRAVLGSIRRGGGESPVSRDQRLKATTRLARKTFKIRTVASGGKSDRTVVSSRRGNATTRSPARTGGTPRAQYCSPCRQSPRTQRTMPAETNVSTIVKSSATRRAR